MNYRVVSLLLLCVLIPVTGHSNPEPVKIGMSTALTGSAKNTGLGMRIGVEAALADQNARGGIHGRSVELITLDDGYEPDRTAPNMRKLINEHGVYAVLGNFGTPTAAVSVPIVNEEKVPLWGAYTGAGLLRNTPPDRYVINYRASYAQEAAEVVDLAIDDLGVPPDKIAFFVQDDSFGAAGYEGAIAALKARGYARAERLVNVRYPRNTLDVEFGISQFIEPRVDIELVIIVGMTEATAKIIRLSQQYGLGAKFIALSPAGAGALLDRLGANLAEGVIVSQVVPHPEHSELPIAKEFRRVVPDPQERSFTFFEGYIAARSLMLNMESAPRDASREQLIEHVESRGPWDLGLGTTHELSPSEHQISHQPWPIVILKGQIVPLKSGRVLE